jgi:DNA polymerase III subunit epsilon
VRGAVDFGCFPTGRHYPGIAHLIRIVAVGLADECDGSTPMSEITLAAIDTETTGRDASVDRIVELACVLWRGGQILARHSWLVNPGRAIPKEAFDIHGIGDDDVRDKPPFEAIVDEVLGVLGGCVPVAYNADYDRVVLSAELARANALSRELPPAVRKGVVWLDPLVWARELQKIEKGKSLGDVCARLGIPIERAHRAADDAEATLRVLEAFSNDVRVPKTYGAFIAEQRRLARVFADDRVRWRGPQVMTFSASAANRPRA